MARGLLGLFFLVSPRFGQFEFHLAGSLTFHPFAAEYRGTKVAIKRAAKCRTKKGSTKSSRNVSKSAGSHTPCESSVANSSAGFVHSIPQDDPEIGDPESNGKAGEEAASGEKSKSSSNVYSLGFLAVDFRQNKWAKFFPWLKQSNYHARFRQTILGSSSSISRKSIGARFCPCFSEQARQEAAFIAEMRVISRLRHPNIRTVLGAVISHTHEPMLVSRSLLRVFFCWRNDILLICILNFLL